MIINNYSDRQTPQFPVLTDRQCQEIFLAISDCLDRVSLIDKLEEGWSLLVNADDPIESNHTSRL